MRLVILVALAMGGCASLDANVCTEELIETYEDTDGDGFGDEATLTEACGAVPAGRVIEIGDCDDGDLSVAPDAPETCNGIDNNCNGIVDDGLPTNPYFADSDSDGFGDPEVMLSACSTPAGYVADDTDCDDTIAASNPGELEICDTLDNDCDGLIDDEDPDVDPTTMTDWHPDSDGDGFGGDSGFVSRCEGPPGAVDDGSDCDDSDPDVNPNGTEVCGGGDENCDGLVDDADPALDPLTTTPWFLDFDGDGFGDVTNSIDACAAPSGYVANPDDCDDSDPLATLLTDWYLDVDLDGFGAGASIGQFCSQPYPGTASDTFGLDCDDNDAFIFPGNVETCGDGIDNDCDPATSDQCALFFDNFEDADFSDWNDISAGQTPGIANFGANGTNYSFSMVGGSGHYTGLMWAFGNETPPVISFYVRSDTNTGDKGYVVFGGSNIGNGNTAVFFRISLGDLTCYDGSQYYYAPFTPGTWHLIEFYMDWAGQNFDWYTDGVLRQSNITFRGSAPTLQEFHMYNFSNNETAYWDEILMTN